MKKLFILLTGVVIPLLILFSSANNDGKNAANSKKQRNVDYSAGTSVVANALPDSSESTQAGHITVKGMRVVQKK